MRFFLLWAFLAIGVPAEIFGGVCKTEPCCRLLPILEPSVRLISDPEFEYHRKRARDLLAGVDGLPELRRRFSRSAFEDHLIPGLEAILAESPFPIDVSHLVSAVAGSTSGWKRAKWILENMDTWKPQTDEATAQMIIRSLIRSEEPMNGGIIAVHMDRLHAQFRDSPMLLMQVLEFIFQHNRFLGLLSSMPFRSLPIDEAKLIRSWAAFDKETPVSFDSVYFVRRVEGFFGDCPDMYHGHVETVLGLGEVRDLGYRQGNAVLVRVRGELVGSIKLVGHPSLVGLRTVRAADGTLPLVLGGVYGIPQDVVKKAMRAAKGAWAVLDLDSLPVFPVAFLAYEFDMDRQRMLAEQLISERLKLLKLLSSN